ncbi:MAG: ABC transporter substrate-binding protein [Solirubrobacterales bacterium]|nr:ABC transporter substrate-binding protein [Solirubrobacterales bacterium]
MSEDSFREQLEQPLTRRQVLHGALVGGATISAGGLLSACGGSISPAVLVPPPIEPIKAGGSVRIGATGGGSKDVIDAHLPAVDPDIMRNWNLYESLATRPANFGPLQMLLAESIEPEKGSAKTWTVKLKPGLEFHNGKSVTADDVIFSINRIIDPKNPKVGATSIGYIDTAKMKKLDNLTIRIPLKFPNATFPDDIGQYFNAIVPVGYDPNKPVGTGACMYESFTPGQQSVFKRFPNYWEHPKPYVDQLTIIDFTDDTARVNALLGGEVDAIDNLPTGVIAELQGNKALRVLVSETGEWQPFTMRVDKSPFNDVRVRQAFRLMVNRPQMIEQVLLRQGRLANDMYSPYDPAYAASLPQRHQDLEQAKSLLKAAGHEGLAVELVTGPIFQGVQAAAQVFAQQASAAGVKVAIRQVDTTTFYGPNYLGWTFAQDFWATRQYLPQVAQGSLPSSPFNETHWADPTFIKLIQQARAQLDESKRNEILLHAQTIEYERGGYIIPYFSDQVDAYSTKLTGFEPAKSGFPLGNYWFKNVGYKA